EIEDVKQGSIVWMKVRGLRDADFEGRVDSIAVVAQPVEGDQVIIVRSQLSGDTANLKPGMTGWARIYAGKRPIISLVTRRMYRWIKTEFVPLLP
ncbi:MAG TPA: hypothetical protein VMT78_13250, partial [Terriglobia bacterium]|nr:hypothetical protein [Terriglobia bacterium]